MKKYLWFFILPLFLFIFIPKDTYALTIVNPKIEIYGYDSSNQLVVLGGCTSCNEDGASNRPGKPAWVRVYLPRQYISSFFNYTVSMSFQWKTSSSFDIWANKPVLIFNNNYVQGVTDIQWTNFLDTVDGLERIRQSNYTFRFYADSSNILFDYYVDIPFTNPTDSNYQLSFASLGIDLITTDGNGTIDDFGVIIDNAKNDIINSNAINQHANQENFDKIQEAITSDNVSGSQGFAKDFFNNFKDDDIHGLSTIVSSPLVMINSLLSSNDVSRCTNLDFTILGSSVYFPNGCIFWDKVPSAVMILYHVIFCGFFGYILVVGLFKDVQQLKNPNSSGVNILDL